MKKFLLPLFAVCLCATSAIADDELKYGTTPETAKPFPAGGWWVESLEDAPKEAWFTIKNEQDVPVLWGEATGFDLPQQIFVYLCDGGQEAFQWMPGDSYALMPNQEYLVKITPLESGCFCMMGSRAFPDSMEGKYPFYPIKMTQGMATTQAPGTTMWYLYDFMYPSQLTFNDYSMMPLMDITAAEAIHIQCPGGTNKGSAIAGPYVKAGLNVVGVTVSEDAPEDFQYIVGLSAFTTLNCGNNLLRGKSMQLDTQETYPDAYYTVDRYFEVPADGTYTFTNHGAAGTILNIGRVKRIDPNNEFKHECDWTDIKSATVGNGDAVITVDNLLKGELVLVQSDAFGVIGAGMENLPYLMVTKGTAGVSNVAADGNSLKAGVSNGVLSVESVLLASGAEVAVYDMNANKVASAISAAGAANLEIGLDVPAGIYVVVVYGKGNSESAKIVVK